MKKYLLSVLFLIAVAAPIKVNAAYDALISGNNVRIRTGAGTNNSIIATVNANTAISVYDKTLYEGNGCSEKWYKILYNDKTGYVCKQYVSFIDTSFDGINVMNWTSRVNANNV